MAVWMASELLSPPGDMPNVQTACGEIPSKRNPEPS